MRCVSLARVARFGLALIVLSALGFGQESSKAIKALEKKLKRVESQITRAEKRLEKRLPKVRKEYQLLLAEETQRKIAAAIAPKVESLRKAGPENADEAQLKPALKRVISELVGTNLLPLYLGDLSVMVFEEIELGKKPGIAEVIKSAITDAFPSGKFEEDFEKRIKPKLSKTLARLYPQRSRLKQDLADARKALEALSAGIPVGMVRVPAQEGTVGISPKAVRALAKQLDRGDDELILGYYSTPEFKVKLPAFYLDEREVTCEWYNEFLKTHPEVPAPWYTLPSGKVIVMWPDRVMPKKFRKRPATGITLLEAKAFARWMGRRLPTETEWELAVRYRKKRGELRSWPWGDTWDKGNHCNSVSCHSKLRNVARDGLPPLVPVGTFPAGRSLLGLYDMSGNAAEWTTSLMRPYKGFKDVEIDGRSLRLGDFNENRYVVRGGHCINKDAVTTTWWRNAAPATGRFPWVGFRTAASTVRGQDHLAALAEDGEYERFLVNYPKLPSAVFSNREYPGLALSDPNTYSGVIAGGWDPERELPAAAQHITIANRDCNDFRSFTKMKGLAGDKPLLLGFLHLDVPSVSPKLEAGQYFILWRNSYVPEEPETEGTTGGEGGKGKTKGKKKTKRGHRKPKKKARRKAVPDAILFQKIGGRRTAPIRMEDFVPPVVTARQPTTIQLRPQRDEVELVYSFPIRRSKIKTFVISIPLKLAPGEVSKFH